VSLSAPATMDGAVTAPAVAERPASTDRIRPFTHADIPTVVEIRREAFRHSVRTSSEDLAAYFARTFLDGPWHDPALPSLVHLDDAGTVNGFVGVVPRRMRFEGRPIRVVVPTQLMVRPGSPSGAGLRLVRTIFEGAQDLTISDVANDAARRLWERVGGHTSHLHSLQWTLPVRRARYAVGRLAHGPMGRALLYALRPACAVLDGSRREPPPPRGGSLTTERFDPLRHVALLNEIAGRWPLHPVYESATLAWQLEETARRPEQGPLEAHLVRDAFGHGLGWFIYFANRGGIGEVVQIVAHPGEQEKVLALLEARARAAGLVALAGRMEPGLADAFAARGVGFVRTGPWFLTHARDPRLYAAVLHGEGLLSRLEGEWWLNF
jgi:predicted N-acetyltransferase YhbS